ncbi:hypothetical protein KP509_09G037600 [Ceratopteris richardii]|uniref:Uncharacterized protein n=1 Tax=Ceratopteris richardii TaxID=49495 RepID=A0A8T2U764_CERRI|nr:hypothetical protein KP509_09G037600 [Ceratopteris richardii]
MGNITESVELKSGKYTEVCFKNGGKIPSSPSSPSI